MPLEVVIKDACSTVGEGPHWDGDSKTLYYVDIYANSVSRWISTTGEIQKITLDNTIGFVIPSNKGSVILGLGQTFSRLEWESKSVTVIQSVDQDKQSRFNDGKCDARGRIWAGTMGLDPVPGEVELGQGSLYCLDTDGRVTKHLTDLNIANGLVWSSDNKTFYFIDSVPGIVFGFDYNIENATISNKKIIMQYQPEPQNKLGCPDGMTIDCEGQLWIACFFGGRIIQINPETGKIICTQHMPVRSPSSCCFGGENYDELFVTSSRYNCTEEDLVKYPLSGSVFRITGLETKGYPLVKYGGN